MNLQALHQQPTVAMEAVMEEKHVIHAQLIAAHAEGEAEDHQNRHQKNAQTHGAVIPGHHPNVLKAKHKQGLAHVDAQMTQIVQEIAQNQGLVLIN